MTASFLFIAKSSSSYFWWILVHGQKKCNIFNLIAAFRLCIKVQNVQISTNMPVGWISRWNLVLRTTSDLLKWGIYNHKFISNLIRHFASVQFCLCKTGKICCRLNSLMYYLIFSLLLVSLLLQAVCCYSINLSSSTSIFLKTHLSIFKCKFFNKSRQSSKPVLNILVSTP